ncbi:DUF2589 domain-containing protein [Selenomonas ruminantium]|uniref:Uncharacterized protein n=1 Tax=Selenomonas ruminantium TaxID=971 RepID=A0A1H3VCY4_SELRU|nr:DUF2589 domain-containing protein [Selenomonas ruminantium]SDZ72667.1 Protein of unknown function [Selenomonas ruminantium]
MKELIRNKMNDTDLGNVVGGNKPEEKAQKKKQPKIEKVPVPVPPLNIVPVPPLDIDKIDISFPSGKKSTKNEKKK